MCIDCIILLCEDNSEFSPLSGRIIQDNKHNNLYEHSDNLLIKLYKDMNDHSIKNIKINPAPHWRLLKDYGGKLTIEEYRKTLNKIEYVDVGLLRNNLKFRMCSLIFNEKNKL